MYHKILVPLDGSPLSESVLPRVQELAARFESRIVLLRAAFAHTMPGQDETEPQLKALREAEEYVGSVAQGMRDRGFPTTECAVWYTDPVSAILEHAASQKIDLIAMSTHGRVGLGRFVLGSVATKVLQASNIPVLLLRPQGDEESNGAPLRRILVPLDGSDLAESVVPDVVALAKGMSAEVILLEVISTEAATDESPLSTPSASARERMKAMDYLEGVERRLSEQGVVARHILRAGSPAEEIPNAAEQQLADLIVMATRARTGVGRMVRGSVADTVVRSVAIPVLLMRGGLGTAAENLSRQTTAGN